MADVTDELNFIQGGGSPSPEEANYPEGEPEEGEASLGYSEEVINLLKTIFRRIETQEMPTREILLRQWKLYQLLWQGIQSVAWSSVAN
jgi:hypothetical protein